MTIASLFLVLTMLGSPQEQGYVSNAGASLGTEIASAIKLITCEISDVSEGSLTLSGGESAGLEKEMTLEFNDGGAKIIVKVINVAGASATAKLMSGRDYPASWKGKSVVESPTLAIAGVYDDLVEGFDDLSRDFCSGIFEALKGSTLKDIAPLEAIEPAASAYTYDLAKDSSGRSAMSAATGANILLVGGLKRESDHWSIVVEALNATSGKVRARAESKLDVSRLGSYQPGAIIYDFKMIDSDSSRRILAGGLKVGSNDRTGKSGLMPIDGRFTLVLVSKKLGKVFDVNFQWQSNRIAPPNNPPKSESTLILHYQDLKNWDGVRMSNNEVFLVGMQEGRQWVGQQSATLAYPLIDSSDGSTIDVVVKGKKVTVKVGDKVIRGELPFLLPSRVGFACVNEDGADPRNTFLVHKCTVTRGSGL